MVWAGPDWLGWLGMIWRDTIVTPLFFFFERMDVWCVCGGGGANGKKEIKRKKLYSWTWLSKPRAISSLLCLASSTSYCKWTNWLSEERLTPDTPVIDLPCLVPLIMIRGKSTHPVKIWYVLVNLIDFLISAVTWGQISFFFLFFLFLFFYSLKVCGWLSHLFFSFLSCCCAACLHA